MNLEKYDVIVVGAGHAGCEAAHAAGKLGSKVLLVTMNMNTIAQMSCNPAMGGVAKGQILREIDALGGKSGVVADRSAIQFRMLNRSKGPAMWSPRTQNDRLLFSQEWRWILESNGHVDFWQEMAVGITTKNGKVTGIKTGMGLTISADTVILTSGTFLNGLIHIGDKKFGGGRSGERAAKGITECLNDLGFSSGRMKTGTPPRVDGRTINYDKIEVQPGDERPGKFSFFDDFKLEKQIPCHITYTNPTTHEILESGFDKSPMFNGAIKSTGPRYCPSIEDKIDRFKERERHQIFVEPEGWSTCEIYVNGFSTSLPEDIQHKAIKTIKGFEKVKMFRPGYAIEYDYFPPTQLTHTLETSLIENLFFAGQINGTTGYEEAACQGLVAGINAAFKSQEREPFILSRTESYIGVLIDDLITKGTKEPYRMFTSRAEHRIILRQDNADLRLSPFGYKIGLLEQESFEKVEQKRVFTDQALKLIKKQSLDPDVANDILESKSSSTLKQKVKSDKVLSRPNIDLDDIMLMSSELKEKLSSLTEEAKEQAEILIKYDGYIKRETETADKLKRLESVRIPGGFDYSNINALSAEAVEKLNNIRPATIIEAKRISGVSPADISAILIHLGR